MLQGDVDYKKIPDSRITGVDTAGSYGIYRQTSHRFDGYDHFIAARKSTTAKPVGN